VDLFTSLWRLENALGGEMNRGNHPGIYAYARLKPGVTVEQARTEMTGIARRLAEQHPNTNFGNSIDVQPLLGAIVEDVRPALIVLMCAVGFVLLIACVNIANLLLSRATERYRELAVRVALGASRWRLVRQLLTECLLLSSVGGILGLLLAVWITAGLLSAPVAGIPRLDEVSADRSVLLFTFGLSMLTGLVFGMFPALQASRTDVQAALKEGGRTGSAGTGRRRLRDVLVAAEIAVSLLLVVGAGLMAKSLLRVLQDDGGIDSSHVLTASYTLPDLRYKDEAGRRAFVNQLVEKAQAIPGVELAGFKNPLLGGHQTAFAVDGRPMPEPGHFPSTDISRVTPGALPAMGIRLLRGRHFEASDNEQAPLVCIVDETLARQYWPNEDAIGKRLAIGGTPAPGQPIPWMTIVGIVAHVKNYGVDQPSRIETYIPNAQQPGSGGNVVIRTSGDPGAAASALRAAVHAVDPDIPLFDLRPLENLVADASAPRRLSVTLIASFAFLALVLAAVGIYGVMAYAVAQRRHEIGIRMALGAQPGEVLRMVLRQGLYLAGAGIAVGLLGALGLSRLIAGLLFQVSAHDAFTFTFGAFVLAAIALLACWIPARRATRVDPVVALRYE
jgi:putative ABC transport system permease protein